MAAVDVLLPTFNRLESLIMTLCGVAAQTLRDLHVNVADQSREPAGQSQVVQTLRRVIEVRGGSVEWHHRPQIHGIAEQRNFLLERATAPAVLYLDDDVLMEPWVAGRLLETLRAERCASWAPSRPGCRIATTCGRTSRSWSSGTALCARRWLIPARHSGNAPSCTAPRTSST